VIRRLKKRRHDERAKACGGAAFSAKDGNKAAKEPNQASAVSKGVSLSDFTVPEHRLKVVYIVNAVRDVKLGKLCKSKTYLITTT
jgi:hypothetical protein